MPELQDMRCPSCESDRLRYVAVMREQRHQDWLVACLSCSRISTFDELAPDPDLNETG
jgi:uncharacterized Zn finger protein